MFFWISCLILFWKEIIKPFGNFIEKIIRILSIRRVLSNQPYSTVLNNTCGYAFLNTDFFFCFNITQRTPHLNVPLYSEYQFFLYETITEQREKGKTFEQIADWLNNEGSLSIRGKKFKDNHVHSIVKKKNLKMRS